MVIKNKQVGSKGMFYVGDDGNIVAELVYTMAAPDKMVIEHTEVDESLKGKNVGLELVNIKIVPLCPFAKSVIARRPEMQDVLYK